MNSFRTGIPSTSNVIAPILATLALTALPCQSMAHLHHPAGEKYFYGNTTETSSMYKYQSYFSVSVEDALQGFVEKVLASQIDSDLEIDNIIADNINELYQYGF